MEEIYLGISMRQRRDTKRSNTRPLIAFCVDIAGKIGRCEE
jgi:hypothetical protein